MDFLLNSMWSVIELGVGLALFTAVFWVCVFIVGALR